MENRSTPTPASRATTKCPNSWTRIKIPRTSTKATIVVTAALLLPSSSSGQLHLSSGHPHRAAAPASGSLCAHPRTSARVRASTSTQELPGGGLRPPSGTSPPESIAPAKPALEPSITSHEVSRHGLPASSGRGARERLAVRPSPHERPRARIHVHAGLDAVERAVRHASERLGDELRCPGDADLPRR